MLSKTLMHIYGPLYVYSYGAIIALGCIVTFFLIQRDHIRPSIISTEQLSQLFGFSIIAAIIGGRALFLFHTQPKSLADLFALNQGGFSVLGSIIALIVTIAWYAKKHELKMLPLLDLVAIYAPLLQAISRIGCYASGCCYGTPTSVPWAITYRTHDTLAPIFCALHPTQLYSSISMFCIFLLLYCSARYHYTTPGQLTSLYLALASLSRFVVDFFRDDREFIAQNSMGVLSLHQWIALILGLGAGSYFMWCLLKKETYST